ncbi:MAG: GIN domain-containing protein [Hyphomonadaceae bacterium]|jgi:hypothetical protein
MHRSLIVLPAVFAIALGGCIVGGGIDGEPYSDTPYSETQRHSYAGFDKVDVSAGVEAVVLQGAFDVKAETTKGEGFDNLIVEVKGDTLHITRKSSLLNWGGEQYRVTVSAPAYSALEASSGSRMEGSNLSLRDLSVEVTSGASVELGGACNALDLKISSGASFEGEGLRCATANVDASSGASAAAFASQLADGEASSGANVTFHGQPKQLREDTSSGGSVRAR